jgi:hypothetical protein
MTDGPFPMGLQNRARMNGAKQARPKEPFRMPLTPYLKGAVFDPQAIEIMNIALTAVLESLRLNAPDDPAAEIVARTIIDLARTGERDPAKLRDLALIALKASDQRSA